MLAVLGPLLWAWLACDLAGLALGTDYARLVRCVVAVAQVRRGGCLPADALCGAAKHDILGLR